MRQPCWLVTLRVEGGRVGTRVTRASNLDETLCPNRDETGSSSSAYFRHAHRPRHSVAPPRRHGAADAGRLRWWRRRLLALEDSRRLGELRDSPGPKASRD